MATKTWHFQTFATMMIRRDYRDRSGGGATKTSRHIIGIYRKTKARLSRPCGSGNGVTGATKLSNFQTFAPKMDTARLRSRRDSKSNGATGLGPNSPFSKILRPRWRQGDFPDRGGDCATKNQFIAKVVEAAWFLRSEWRRRDVLDQGGDSATFQIKAETAWLSRPRRRRRD